jgi:hypothetical protein
LPPSKKKRIFNFLQVTLSNKSQSQEEHKSPATQVMCVAPSMQPPPSVAAVEGDRKGRKFDFKISAPEVTCSVRPEESNHESYTQELEQDSPP